MKENEVPFVFFRKYHVKENGKAEMKKVEKEFSMPLCSLQEKNKPMHFHLLVLLQSVGDEVSIIEE